MKGAMRLGRWRGVPVFLHWSTPLGFLLFVGFRPVSWFALTALILAHEWGHAALIRRCGLRVDAIYVLGTGGECTYTGQPSPLQRALIAWGGVLGQLPGLILGLLGRALLPPSAPTAVLETAVTLVDINLFLIGLNLLPIPPLDGWHAWRLFAPSNLRALVRRRGTRQALHEQARAIERELAELEKRRAVN